MTTHLWWVLPGYKTQNSTDTISKLIAILEIQFIHLLIYVVVAIVILSTYLLNGVVKRKKNGGITECPFKCHPIYLFSMVLHFPLQNAGNPKALSYCKLSYKPISWLSWFWCIPIYKHLDNKYCHSLFMFVNTIGMKYLDINPHI